MSAITSILGIPFGWVMWLCYVIVRNYGFALLIFTIITRLIMIPFTIKQQKSMGKMALLQPRITELQNKYKDPKQKEKLNEEMMKLYQEEKYNPMSGCLPLLIQFPILFGLIDVIYKPLKHIVRLPADVIVAAENLFKATLPEGEAINQTMIQLEVVSGVQTNPSLYSSLGADVIERIQNLNFTFLGMDLTQKPELGMFSFTSFNPIVLIPFLAGLSQLVMSIVSMKTSSNPQQGAGSMKGMMYTMPLISVWFAFSVTAGVGLYWFYSGLVGLGQHLLMNKIYNPKEMAEKARMEMEERKERERQERIEAKRAAKEQGLPVAEEKALTAKEINRRKLAEARRRDAEKYGEEYVEVTDDDLK